MSDSQDDELARLVARKRMTDYVTESLTKELEPFECKAYEPQTTEKIKATMEQVFRNLGLAGKGVTVSLEPGVPETVLVTLEAASDAMFTLPKETRAALPEPTGDDCSENKPFEYDGRKWFAGWYPQMGGYGGKCLIEQGGPGDCFDVLVWHDGEFPFGEGSREPIRLHHCSAEQFVRFGELVERLQENK